MATFTSRKYPSLVVRFSNREKVRFDGGEVEVNEDQAERLAEFAKHHPDLGIAQADVEPDEDDDLDPDDEDDDDLDDDSDDEDDSDDDDEDADGDSDDEDDHEPESTHPF